MLGVFQLEGQKVTFVVHVDDTLMVGTKNSLRMVRKRLEEIYELKHEIIGPERHHMQEVKYLGCHMCWTDNGITFDGDTEHLDQQRRDLDVLHCSFV